MIVEKPFEDGVKGKRIAFGERSLCRKDDHADCDDCSFEDRHSQPRFELSNLRRRRQFMNARP
jgi:hypothetical protein